jgi:hypothetical protein
LIIFILYSIFLCFEENSKSNKVKSLIFKKKPEEFAKFVNIIPLVRIQIKDLFSCNFTQIVVSSFFSILSFVVLIALLKYSETGFGLMSICSILILVNSLALSNFFVKIADQRVHYRSYLGSLPTTHLQLFITDMISVGSVLIVYNLCVVCILNLFFFQLNLFQFFYVTCLSITYLGL